MLTLGMALVDDVTHIQRPSGVPVGGVAVDLLRATRLGLQNSSNGGGGR